MDYEIYSFEIRNMTESKIKIDSREKTDNVYVVDKNGNKYSALLHENTEQEMVLEPNETKRINIKFSDTYREGIVINKIVFNDIVINYNEDNEQRGKIEMDL